MKKTLIALAALAATGAFAQSSVTIDGIMDAGFQSINYKGTTASDIGNNGSSTSQINFRGSEDLGGGLKAEFRFESDWNTVSNRGNTGAAAASGADGSKVTTASFGNGELRVGLAGNFGRVDFGAVNYNSLTTFLMGQPFGTAVGGGFRASFGTDAASTSGFGGSAVRSDNAFKYTSPNLSGFTITLYNVAKNTKASSSTQYTSSVGGFNHNGASEIGVNYSNGPLNASFSQNASDSTDVGGVGTGQIATLRTLAVNYSIGNGLTLYLLNQRSSGPASVDTASTAISASYTMGNHVLMALLGNGTNGGTGSNGTTNTMTGLGYDYNLSKRTAAYVRYESINDNLGIVTYSGLTAGTDTVRTRTAIGLRHNF